MKRADAAQQAAQLLWIAEESVFTAIRDVSALTVGLIDIRRAAGVSPVVGQGPLDQLAQTATALHAGRSGIVAHAELLDVKQRIGAGRIQLNGGGDKADAQLPAYEEVGVTTPLRVVG